MKTGVVLARFQTAKLHDGHKEIMKRAYASSHRVAVLLGVSPMDTLTRKNPLSFAQRKEVVQRDFPQAIVLPVYNKNDHIEWSEQVDTILSNAFPFDECTLHVGRDSNVTEYYKGRYPIDEMGWEIACSATAIRESITEEIGQEFLRGQIFANCRRFPTSYQTVDVGLIIKDKLLFDLHGVESLQTLLIRRADTGLYCFPGGFVDPTDYSLETAASRELKEEIGLDLDGQFIPYAGSIRVQDWRYRWEDDQIMTSLFAPEISPEALQPIKQDKLAFSPWKIVNPEEVSAIGLYGIFHSVTAELMADCHKPLLNLLRQYITRKIKL